MDVGLIVFSEREGRNCLSTAKSIKSINAAAADTVTTTSPGVSKRVAKIAQEKDTVMASTEMETATKPITAAEKRGTEKIVTPEADVSAPVTKESVMSEPTQAAKSGKGTR